MSLNEDEIALYGSIIIGLGRVYDVLLSMYGEDYPAKAAMLREMHEKGHMFFPPPSFVEDDEDDE